MSQETNTPITFEIGDLIEDLDLHIDHAEKFLLCVEGCDSKPYFECGNGNAWGFPKNGINLGPVVVAYARMRSLAAGAIDAHGCSCLGCAKDRQTFLELTKQNTKQES
jgi:hypothetical protein